MKTTKKWILSLALGLAVIACKKKEDPTPAPTTTPSATSGQSGTNSNINNGKPYFSGDIDGKSTQFLVGKDYINFMHSDGSVSKLGGEIQYVSYEHGTVIKNADFSSEEELQIYFLKYTPTESEDCKSLSKSIQTGSFAYHMPGNQKDNEVCVIYIDASGNEYKSYNAASNTKASFKMTAYKNTSNSQYYSYTGTFEFSCTVQDEDGKKIEFKNCKLSGVTAECEL